MSIDTPTSDWKAAPVAQVGGSAVIGGGVYWVNFVTKVAQEKELFMFIGGGFGVGGSVGSRHRRMI